MSPLELNSHMADKHHSGEKTNMQWDLKNKGNYRFNGRNLFVFLAPLHLLLFSEAFSSFVC